MTPQAVIFDCDGVLVDSEPLTTEMIRDDLAAHGLDLPVARINTLFVGGTISGLAAQSRKMGARLPEDWVETFYRRLCRHLAAYTPLIPGILSALDALDRAGVPYAVGSNGRHVKMDATLGQHPDLARRFQRGRNRFAASDVALPKPAPDLYLHAARALNTDPAACVVIEDSATGARAARAAGIPCLGYAPHDDGAALKAEGARLFTDMVRLPDLLELTFSC